MAPIECEIKKLRNEMDFFILYFYRNLSLCVNYAFNYGTITADYVTITFSLKTLPKVLTKKYKKSF